MRPGIRQRAWLLAFVTVALSHPAQADREVLLASAELGTTGRFGGTSITDKQFVGWRFELAETLEVLAVGGHLFGVEPDVPDAIFAAIVRLDHVDAFPRGSPWLPEEIVAVTTFSPPLPSAEVFTPLAATLQPGAYALVYGSGLFGASENGGLHNGPDQPDIPPTTIDSYIFFGIPRPNAAPIWRGPLASNMRFLVRGTRPGEAAAATVPALPSAALITLALALVALQGWWPGRYRRR